MNKKVGFRLESGRCNLLYAPGEGMKRSKSSDPVLSKPVVVSEYARKTAVAR
jgi:hypothetical protein